MGPVAAVPVAMKCFKCEAVVPDDTQRCQHCGADLIPQPSGSPVESEPSFTSGSLEAEAHPESDPRGVEWGFVLDHEFERLYEKFKTEEAVSQGKHWGGFFRRCCAFSIDLIVLSVLSLLLLYTSYVGYRVGLAAFDRTITMHDLFRLLRIVCWGWLAIGIGYFVLFHGLDGKTIGKWLMSLRVVGADRKAITCRQAAVRCLGYFVSAFFGLGFFWILLNREKRGWHDFLAHTWVVRESFSRDEED